MSVKTRPLSPHLQAYRLPITAVISISHRITGVLLTIGTLVWVLLLISLATNEAVFNVIRDGIATPVGRLLLWLWIYAFLFHLCHGFRHLIWDVGMGFQRERMTRYASFELLASATLLVSIFAASLILS